MAVTLTTEAVAKVKELIEASKNTDDWKKNGVTEENVVLRLALQGGGCSGLSYDLRFDSRIGEHDRVYEADGVKVVVDKKSLLYADGTEIGYAAQGITGGFTFQNPNAKSTCGCGSSFHA